jgi:glycerophosphoryl diester phosphodiesterase
MQLAWHMARGAREEAPNTLAGIECAIAAGASRIEVDVRMLADDDALLCHDRRLADGRIIRELRAGDASSGLLPRLSQAVARVAGSDAILQVDLKDETPLDADQAERLLHLLAPLSGRVIVGSMFDWSLRTLRAADQAIALGFDPLLYFHYWEKRPADVPFPRRQGAYGYWDDHSLATAPTVALGEYLAIRLEALRTEVPAMTEIMLHLPTLTRVLDDGVDAVRFFHERGVEVLAWTLDADAEGADAVFARLTSSGVDTLVTNTAPEFLGREPAPLVQRA